MEVKACKPKLFLVIDRKFSKWQKFKSNRSQQ